MSQSADDRQADVKAVPTDAVDMWSLAGHRILVTGGTGPRVGSGICDALHAAGAQLVINGPTQAEVDATLARYPGAYGVVGDVSVERDVERFIAEARDRVGQLTGLVNNAGIGLRTPVDRVTSAQFDDVVGVDFRGVWLATRAFVAQRSDTTLPAAIVNVSSVHATATMPQYAVYAAAKAAVEGLTRGCAVDLGPAGIRCNAIAPGYVPANPALSPDGPAQATSPWALRHAEDEQVLPHVIEPVDCGWAVRFLLSAESRSITGQVLTVDAGVTARLYSASMSRAAHEKPDDGDLDGGPTGTHEGRPTP